MKQKPAVIEKVYEGTSQENVFCRISSHRAVVKEAKPQGVQAHPKICGKKFGQNP